MFSLEENSQSDTDKCEVTLLEAGLVAKAVLCENIDRNPVIWTCEIQGTYV